MKYHKIWHKAQWVPRWQYMKVLGGHQNQKLKTNFLGKNWHRECIIVKYEANFGPCSKHLARAHAVSGLNVSSIPQ